ncbi:MAG: hypothetical protein HYU37_00125 [Acidobacteria bacterium]|nr:hypothetical protein [Acidobacteriota bacterium]
MRGRCSRPAASSPVVERFLDARPGELLTAGRFTRAERRLAEFPAAMSARLDYVPVSSGLAELRGAVAERPLVPRGRATIATAALAAAATREVRLSSGALTGGGEELSFGYRFWRHRQRVDGELQAPAPWGGLWRIDAFLERQPFAGATRALAERAGVRVGLSDWANGHLRWSLAAGIDEWTSESRGALAGGGRWASLDDTLDAAAHVQAWPGRTGFATVGVTTRARSSVDGGRVRTLHPRAFVVIGTVTAQFVTVRTPLDLWPAGDTGHARPTLARAHPLLDDGALVVDRLGRTLLHATAEGRRWWRVRGPIRAAVAAFADAARTGRRWTGAALTDLDAGIGARLALDGMPGLFRIDLAKGLRDGATVISVGYEPWDLVLE